jgi:hypothetical protein
LTDHPYRVAYRVFDVEVCDAVLAGGVRDLHPMQVTLPGCPNLGPTGCEAPERPDGCRDSPTATQAATWRMCVDAHLPIYA